MRVHVAFTPEEAARVPTGIVVDVLRATSTIVQALDGGYRTVYCCAEVEEARTLRDELGDAVLGGEESGGFAIRGHIPERDGILAGLYFSDMIVKEGKPLSTFAGADSIRSDDLFTIPCTILVPAAMELLGDANWWFPKWLARFVPQVQIEAEEVVVAHVLAQAETETRESETV